VGPVKMLQRCCQRSLMELRLSCPLQRVIFLIARKEWFVGRPFVFDGTVAQK
jgi:hypothetical protein